MVTGDGDDDDVPVCVCVWRESGYVYLLLLRYCTMANGEAVVPVADGVEKIRKEWRLQLALNPIVCPIGGACKTKMRTMACHQRWGPGAPLGLALPMSVH